MEVFVKGGNNKAPGGWVPIHLALYKYAHFFVPFEEENLMATLPFVVFGFAGATVIDQAVK